MLLAGHANREIEYHDGILKMPWKALTGWIVVISFLAVTFVMGAIFYVWLYMQQVKNGYRLAKLYEEQETLMAIERKLKLEWCRFQDPNQLEELGRNRFGLAPPRQDQKILVR